LDTLFWQCRFPGKAPWRGTWDACTAVVTVEEVIAYDHVDEAVPMLARIASKRQAEYRALGYVVR